MPSKPGKPQPAGVGMTPSKTKLGAFIREHRLALNLKQIPLAKQLGIPQTSLSALEVGIHKGYGLDDERLCKFAETLQCDPEELRKHIPEKVEVEARTELGKMIRARRKEQGLSIETFARRMKIGPDHVSKWELGSNQSLSPARAKRLAKVLKLEPSVITPFIGREKAKTVGELGQCVRSRRKELFMNMSDLAKQLGASHQWVRMVEGGRLKLYKSKYTDRLAKVLQLDPGELEALRPAKKPCSTTVKGTLGEFVAQKRLELDLTQKDLAKRAGMSLPTVIAMESGSCVPHQSTLIKIAEALQCVSSELMSHDTSAFARIKQLSNLKTRNEVNRRAREILSHLLEKQDQGYLIFLCKDDEVIEFDPLVED